jgi:nicotinamide-nucleotide amidase
VVTRALETAEIIAVGSELLTPHRIDTNSLFLTARLNALGITVRAKAVVGDDRRNLAGWLRDAVGRVDVVVMTGGLGPTADDVTREVAAEVLGRELEEDEAILEGIRARFARRGAQMPEINRRQAMVPRGALVLPNGNGTAPGLLVETDAAVVVLLPGPPREMKPMFDAHVAPRLAPRTGGRRLRTRVIKTTGRSESQIEESAFPVYSRLGNADVAVETTILASPGQIELHLAATGTNEALVDRALDEGVEALVRALGPVVFSRDGRSLEEIVGAALHARGLRVATAESCTGGLLAGRLTDVSGSSAWVLGGVIAYDNAVKVEQLGVPPALLEQHGAVSEPVAEAMAAGVRLRLAADVGVAITGIAGPLGGSAEKPVGTVVIAVSAARPSVRRFLFPGDREAIRRHATSAALDMVRRAIEA